MSMKSAKYTFQFITTLYMHIFYVQIDTCMHAHTVHVYKNRYILLYKYIKFVHVGNKHFKN